MSDIKKELEAAAVASTACPSCKAAAGKPCHYIGSGGGLVRLRKVPTHQRRMSKYVSENVRFK